MKRLLSTLALTAVAGALLVSGPAYAMRADEPAMATVVTSGSSQDHRATAVATPRAGTGTSTTLAAVSYRHYWGAKNGQWTLTLNGLPVTAGQAVAVSATESDGAGGEFVGAARITVHNVSVGNGVVTVRVNIEWGSPINVWLHYLG